MWKFSVTFLPLVLAMITCDTDFSVQGFVFLNLTDPRHIEGIRELFPDELMLFEYRWIQNVACMLSFYTVQINI